MNKDSLVSIKKASQIIGVHPQTLRAWDKKGIIIPIRIGEQRRYNIAELQKLAKKNTTQRKNIIYARVSSRKQKTDLEHQVLFMKNLFTEYEVITDIGSGVNFEREGINRILEMSHEGVIGTVAIAYKDRIARIGYQVIEKIIRLGGGKIVVVNDKSFSPEQELVADLIAITTSFSAKIHGRRKRKYTKGGAEDSQSDDQSIQCHETCIENLDLSCEEDL